MKKIMLSLAMALVSVCASAQVYIGGTAGISSNKIGDGDSKTAYKLIPEIGYQFNNKWDAGIEVGIQKGEVCKISPVGDATTFTIAPYVRYTAVESKVVDLFFEGTIGYGSVSKGGGDFYEVGIKPGLAVKLLQSMLNSSQRLASSDTEAILLSTEITLLHSELM